MATVSQFGKRWDIRVPRNAISHMVNREHVSRHDDDVAAFIGERVEQCRADRPDWQGLTDREFKTIKRQSMAFARMCHARNFILYAKVMGGRL